MILPLIIILITNCAYQEQNKEITMENSEKNLPNEFMLPTGLLFLKDGQIWQLNKEGMNSVQITNEADPITEFDFSASRDRLVYVSGNELILAQMDGSDRNSIRRGQVLVSIKDQLEMMNDELQIKYGIRSPRFSVDGSKISFVENGLWIMDVETEKIDLIWENSSDYQNIIYRLLTLSPDGENFLVSEYALPVKSLYDITIGLVSKDRLVTLPNTSADGFAWYAGGKGLILSQSKVGHPGSLMRCVVDEFRCVGIAEFEPARWYYYYAFPRVVDDVNIQVFMAAIADPSQIPDRFKLIRVNLQGNNRQELMPEEFPVELGLWSPDGNGVVVQLSKTMQDHSAGAFLWVDLVQKKIYELPVSGVSQMKWGGNRQN